MKLPKNALAFRPGLPLTLLLAAFLAGCQSLPLLGHKTPPPSAQVLRWLDEAGLTHNDQRTITTPEGIAHLRAFFPQMSTDTSSSVRGSWRPLIVVHFRNDDGTDTYVGSDYRLYRIDDGRRGDFVVAQGFSDYIDQLFSPRPPQE